MPTVTEQEFLYLPQHRSVIENEPPSVVKVIDVNTLITAPSEPISFLASTSGKLTLIALILAVIITVAGIVIVIEIVPKSATTTTTTTTFTTTTIYGNTTSNPCAVGYTGSLCSTPLCNGFVNGCYNNGTCSAPSVCTCSTGWTGANCTTTTTAVCPCTCANGGTCVNGTCACRSQFSGNCCTIVVFTGIMWPFDGNLNDYYGVFNAGPDNGRTAEYVYPGYNGYGAALSLGLHGTYQSATISTFLSLYHISFTLEAWIYPTAFVWTYGGSTDNFIFGQCQQAYNDECLHICLRTAKLYFAFYGDDLAGTTTFVANRWYHVAFAYDKNISQQYVYVNGVLDGQRTCNQFNGVSGNFTIGTSTTINIPNNYFQGYFDQMSFLNYTRSAAQVLDDATHVVYYKFDTSPGLITDSGPLSINGIGYGVSLSSSPSVVNQSLYFPSGTNYYQFQGLTYFGNSGWPYSISLWIYPLSASGGTIVHASGGYTTDGVGTTDWCLPMLGFSSSGVLHAQSASSTSSLVVLTGPTVALNTWTYVAITYSTTTGLLLYINGLLQSSSTVFTFISSGSQNTITLGNGLSGASSSSCPQGSITSAQYQGYIDSFNLYSRALNASEIATLYTTPQP